LIAPLLKSTVGEPKEGCSLPLIQKDIVRIIQVRGPGQGIIFGSRRIAFCAVHGKQLLLFPAASDILPEIGVTKDDIINVQFLLHKQTK
jgi:hypothetical protein